MATGIGSVSRRGYESFDPGIPGRPEARPAAAPAPLDAVEATPLKAGLFDFQNLPKAAGGLDFQKIGNLIKDLFKPIPVNTGLGKEIDAVAGKSFTLSHHIKALQDQGYRFQWGTAGGGSFLDRDAHTVTLDPNMKGNTLQVVQTLAHEVGHGMHPEPKAIPPKGLTHDLFIKLNVDQHLTDEGAANFENAKVREELIAAGAGDIGIAGSQQDKYLAIYDDFKKGKITKQDAEYKMGQLFGNETTSNTGENYRTYYGKTYEQQWTNYQLMEAVKRIAIPWWPW
jgi:hypothetical protein